MKFIKQCEDSKDVINLDFCSNFYTMQLSNHEKQFVIRFILGANNEDQYETWYYEEEPERDLQFKYICELVKVQSIGN